jgi:polar amino acid transport system substrate-binding protein
MSPTSRRQLLRGIGGAAIAVPLLSALDACSRTEGGNKNSATGKGQKLKVAIGNEPPYTKLNPDGTITGAEPDVLQAVLSKMGYGQVEGVQVDYDGMIPGLNSGRWDVIAAGLFMNQSSCAAIHYTSPVIVSTESFAVLPGNPKSILSVADLKADKSLKVAAIAGGFHEGFIKAGGVPTSQILQVRDTVSGIDALKSGRVDAFCLSELSLNDFKKQQGGFDVTAPIPDAPESGSGAAFREDDKELWGAYEVALESFKKTQEFADILTKWGFNAEAPLGVTVEELCASEG